MKAHTLIATTTNIITLSQYVRYHILFLKQCICSKLPFLSVYVLVNLDKIQEIYFYNPLGGTWYFIF